MNKRLQFLARAEACLKAAEMGNASAGSLWQTIEDKREVAEIQKQILNTLAQLVSNSETVEAVQKLNADLFDVQTVRIIQKFFFNSEVCGEGGGDREEERDGEALLIKKLFF